MIHKYEKKYNKNEGDFYDEKDENSCYGCSFCIVF